MRCQFISRGVIRCNSTDVTAVSSSDVRAAVVEFDEQFFATLDPAANITVEGNHLCQGHAAVVESAARFAEELVAL